MMSNVTRRRFLQGTVAVGAIGAAGCLGDAEDDRSYEIWALDQGTDLIYVYTPEETDDDSDEPAFELIEEIDVAGFEETADDAVVPHMISFSSDYEYAAVACTAGAQTLVFRTEDHELVAAIDTGAGSHFSGFTPDDEYIVVDVIGEEKIVRVDANLDDEEFEIADEILVREDETIVGAGIESGSPICHSYDQSGRSIHTMGPSYHDGALVIVDHDDFTVDAAFSGDELPTNCGTMPHPSEEKFYLTAGLPTPTDDDGEPIEGEEGVGDYYVLDTESDEIIVDGASTGGTDAHGFWFTTDGEELWVLNRETNDGVVIDPDTDDVIEEIEAYGPAQSEDSAERDSPDIMWASPDGAYMFVTLRGSNPVSGDPHAATGVTPGFSVLDTDTKEILDVVVPDGDNEDSDFHGIGVRPIGDYGDAITSPPF